MLEEMVPKCIDLERRNGGRNGRSFRLPLLGQNASTRLKAIRDDTHIRGRPWNVTWDFFAETVFIGYFQLYAKRARTNCWSN